MDDEHQLPDYAGTRTYAGSPTAKAFQLYANSPEAKALLAFAEGPAAKALRTYATSPETKALFAFVEGPAAWALGTYANSPEAKALLAFVEGPAAKALGTYVNGPEVKALLAFMEGPAAKALRTYANSPAAKALQSYLGSPGAQMLQTATNPIARISREVTGIAGLAHGSFSFRAEWEIELAKRAAALGPSWEIGRGTNSAVGFAKLAQLSDAASSSAPYSLPVTELFESELGNSRAGGDEDTAELRDAAAIAAGLHPELIAFPSVNFPSVVIAAGFKLLLPAISVPQPIESADSSAMYEPRNVELFHSVEQSLRDLVESKLLGVVGPEWVKRRVPEAVGRRWQQRQSEERDLRRPVYGLIRYADFIDLADVITRGDNWNEVFQKIFVNKDDFRVSLARLHPIRKAIAHCRPLGRADVLTLVAEATRILSALGLATLA